MFQITKNPVWKSLIVFVGLVACGAGARVAFQHIPNFAPVAAIALFAGYYFRSRAVAICVPLFIMMVSDRLIDAGGYSWPLMLAVYGLLSAPVMLQGILHKRVRFEDRKFSRLSASALTVCGCSLACSLLFFFGTNTMVWATTSLYPQTATGLASCFTAAIPFFRYTLAGDMAFSFVFFGSFALAKMIASATDESTSAIATSL